MLLSQFSRINVVLQRTRFQKGNKHRTLVVARAGGWEAEMEEDYKVNRITNEHKTSMTKSKSDFWKLVHLTAQNLQKF